MGFYKNQPSQAPLIAHAWLDYVPSSFIEPHSTLKSGSRFRSINLVASLWDNGNSVDPHTFFHERLGSENLVNPSLFHRLRRRLSLSWRLKEFKDFCSRSVNERKVSLVHSHFGTTGCELAPLLDKLYIPHIVTMYGYDASAALKKPEILEKYKVMFECADHFVVLSNIVKNRLIRVGCDPKKITVWNMPAGVERYPLRKKIRGEQVRIVMAARFVEAKGHEYALEALSILIKKNHKVRLTLVGYGNQLKRIENRIAELGLRPYVSIMDNKLMGDFASDYRSLLNESDIFILPSIQDKHGTDEAGPALTLVCAQAAGLPVVCTPFPGAEISVIDGVTGLYCKEKCPDSLAEKIEVLIENPNMAEKFGILGSRLVNNEFSEQLQMEKLISIYQECLGIDDGSTGISAPVIEAPAFSPQESAKILRL